MGNVKYMKLSIIFPYRPGNKYYDTNLVYVRNKLEKEFPKSEIILGEEDNTNLPFSRSNAINNGVAQSNNNILMIHDTDMLLPKKNIEKGTKLLKTYPMIYPYYHYLLLSKETSQKIKNGMDYTYEDLLKTDIQELGEPGNIGGGAILLRRDAYDTIGGYDERFIGWGWEDVLFNYKIKETYPVYEGAWGKWLDNDNIFHLWHPEADKNNNNQKLYEKLAEKFVEEKDERPIDSNTI